MDRKEIESLITKVIRQNDMRNRQGKNLQDVLMGILQYISDSGGTHNKGDFFTKLASLIDTDNPSE